MQLNHMKILIKLSLVIIFSLFVKIPETAAEPSVTKAISSTIISGRAELISKKTPSHFKISQNYPNPFNSLTTFEYSLPNETDITITIYNILGYPIRHLIDRSHMAGTYRLQWDGKDDFGKSVASGLYLSLILTNENSAVKKMLLLK